MFFGKNTIAHKFDELKEKYEEFRENDFIKILESNYGEKNEPNFLITTQNRLEKDDKDNMISSFEDLFNSNNSEINSFAKVLFPYSYFTSGFNQNLFTFFTFLPNSIIKDFKMNDGRIISYNEFIKDKLNKLNTDVLNEQLFKLSNDIFKSNLQKIGKTSLVSFVRPNFHRFAAKDGNLQLVQLKNNNLFIGVNETGEYLYKPYIQTTLNNKKYLLQYIGYENINNKPIYKVIDKKGYKFKGNIVKEYGLTNTIFDENKAIDKIEDGMEESFINSDKRFKGVDFVYLPIEVQTLTEYIQNIEDILTENESPFLSDEEIAEKRITIEFSSELTEEQREELNNKYKHCK
jgi:hypothetical protein